MPKRTTRRRRAAAAGICLALAGPVPAALAAEIRTDPDPLGFESALTVPPGHWQQHLTLDLGMGQESRGSHLVWRYGLTDGLTLAADIDEVHLAPLPGAGAHWGFGLQMGLHDEDVWPALAAGLRETAAGQDFRLTGFLAWQRHIGVTLLQGDVEIRQALIGGGTHLTGHLDATLPLGPAAWLIEVESDSELTEPAPRLRLIPGWRQRLWPSVQVGVGLPVGLSPSSPPVGLMADVIASW